MAIYRGGEVFEKSHGFYMQFCLNISEQKGLSQNTAVSKHSEKHKHY